METALLDFDGLLMAMSAEDHVLDAAPIWHLAYTCPAGEMYQSVSSQVAISRYKVAMVVDKKKRDLIFTQSRCPRVAPASDQIQILTDVWNLKKGPTSSMQQR